MKKFNALWMLLLAFMFSFLNISCTPATASAITDDFPTTDTVAYKTPTIQFIQCFTDAEEDEAGNCPDKISFSTYLTLQVHQIDVKQLGVVTDKEAARSFIKSYFPEIDKEYLKDHMLSKVLTVAQLMPVFEHISYHWGVPKYISISYFVNETGWGTSSAFKNKLNLGGIGGDSNLWSFTSLADATYTWGSVLSLDRYTTHIDDRSQPMQWLKAYEKGGYYDPVLAPKALDDRLCIIKRLGLYAIENSHKLPALDPGLIERG